MTHTSERRALSAILLALASVALPPAHAGGAAATYTVASGDVSRACPTALVDVGGACLQLTTSNLFDFDISVTDDTGLTVGGYYEVSVNQLILASGFFCNSVHVHTNWANPPLVKVFPTVVSSTRACGAPATSGTVRISW